MYISFFGASVYFAPTLVYKIELFEEMQAND
jgi:hypothetical protein